VADTIILELDATVMGMFGCCLVIKLTSHEELHCFGVADAVL
jgi:hypothetical protein